MKKIASLISTGFILLFLNVSFAQAACTPHIVLESTCPGGVSCLNTYGIAFATEDNTGDCRALCKSWSTDPNSEFSNGDPINSYRYTNWVDGSLDHWPNPEIVDSANATCEVASLSNFLTCSLLPFNATEQLCNY